MFEFNDHQWRAWEAQVVTDFISRAIEGWHRHFPDPAGRFGRSLARWELEEHARAVMQACESSNLEDAVAVTELMLLAWQSAALGLAQEYITDSLSYAVDECDGNEFGRRWWACQLSRMEQAIHAPSVRWDTPRGALRMGHGHR